MYIKLKNQWKATEAVYTEKDEAFIKNFLQVLLKKLR